MIDFMNLRKQRLLEKTCPGLDLWTRQWAVPGTRTDMVLPGMLYGKTLRSPHAHARIKSIDTSKAEKIIGVKAVVTGVHDTPRGGVFGIIPHTRDHILLPYDKVRYMGEEVAAVAAVDEDTAEEAIEAIKVEYEPLPFVLTWQDAMKEGAPLVHDHRPQNMAAHYLVNEGDVDAALKR